MQQSIYNKIKKWYNMDIIEKEMKAMKYKNSIRIIQAVEYVFVAFCAFF